MNRSQSTLIAIGLGVAALGLTARAQFAPPERVIWPPHPSPVPRPHPVLNQELQLVSQSARVEINGGVAKTRLEQTFENTTDRTVEGTYVFPLPEGAAISGFAMNVNGKRVEAEILDGDKAREIYTGIVQKMRDPAILEFIDRNLVRARIFPIPARSQPKVELEYSESLKPETAGKEGGSFRYVLPLRLPVGGTARAANIDIQLHSPQGLRAIYSPTHAIDIKRNGESARVTGEFSGETRPRQSTLESSATSGISPTTRSGSDRDFVLYFTTAKARVGVDLITHRAAGEDGYFMLLVAPDTQIAAKEIAAKDVVFVFDTSGSMAGDKIEQARRALLTLLSNLNPKDRFNIITFSSDTRAFRERIVPVGKDTLDAARTWIGEIKAVGGTNINDALVDGLKMLGDETRPQQMVFMTDGQPTVGETDIAQILKNVRAANARRTETNPLAARLFAFGVGFDVNTRLWTRWPKTIVALPITCCRRRTSNKKSARCIRRSRFLCCPTRALIGAARASMTYTPSACPSYSKAPRPLSLAATPAIMWARRACN
ncbi:MAG: Ca-activated chloride channel [Abditibacteriota bacterium]|nr:Ca-activated chloride channel [Abditibacteriota bacterium]